MQRLTSDDRREMLEMHVNPEWSSTL